MGMIAVGRNCEILPSLFERSCVIDVVVIYILTGAFHYVTCYYISRPGSCFLVLIYACHSKGRWPTVDIRNSSCRPVKSILQFKIMSCPCWDRGVAFVVWVQRTPSPCAPLFRAIHVFQSTLLKFFRAFPQLLGKCQGIPRKKRKSSARLPSEGK